MSILDTLQADNFQIGKCAAIIYNRHDNTLFKPGLLGELYFSLRGNRYNNRDGTGILETLFCGMTDVSYDAIVAYLTTRPMVILGVWEEDAFKIAGFCFPTVMMGGGEEKACFAGYGFFREFWGTAEEEVLALLGISVLFQTLDLLSIHGMRYSGNDLTSAFMKRFGFRDVGTIPHYMLKRGKLVDAVVSTLSRQTFESRVEQMVIEAYSGRNLQNNEHGERQSIHRADERDTPSPVE